MSYNNKLLNTLNLTAKSAGAVRDGDEDAMTDMMSDPSYLRQSSALINDALQKGFDVLQLADGDIVMTGVKTVVYQYSWDSEKAKLVRSKASSSKKRAATSSKLKLEEELDEEV